MVPPFFFFFLFLVIIIKKGSLTFLMDKIERKSIAFDPDQLKEFDSVSKKMGYKNRSEAIRDVIRDFVLETRRVHDKDLRSMGTFTFIYNHHAKGIQKSLMDMQHKYKIVYSSTHVHVDSDECVEVLILKGKIVDMEKLSTRVLAMKGVKHGRLVITGPFSKE